MKNTAQSTSRPNPLPVAGKLVDLLVEAVFELDRVGNVVSLNRAATEMIGGRAASLIGQPISEIYRVLSLASQEMVRDPASEALEREGNFASPEERLLLRADGAELTVRDRAMLRLDECGQICGAWLVVEDLTELRAIQHEQLWLEQHDPATGLPNRHAFERRVEEMAASAREEQRSHALGFVDLDDFEIISDTFGAVAGDEMVKQVAYLLRSELGDQDLVARLSSDRLGVVLTDCARDRLEERAGQLRLRVARDRFRWQEESFELGLSLGMVPVTPDSGELAELLGAADAASSRAKEDGLEIYQFDSESSGDIFLAEHYGEMRWLSRIHRALKRGRFRLFRQPIVRVDQPDLDRVPLYEVLIRMLDEQGNLVPPNVFIQAAERFHIISTLDRWVVRTTLHQLAASGEPAAVSINLSGQSLCESRFLDFVLQQLDRTGADPSKVCFEITETAAVANLDRARRFMAALRERGCRFVLDDFGSGFSSFAYLKDLDARFLKIDRQFVGQIVEDPLRAAIVRSVQEIGRVLDLKVIAEGVETQETLDVLRDLGIELAQGFFIREPQLWWLEQESD